MVLKGSDDTESWNSFNFTLTTTDISSNLSDSSYFFTVNTEPNCLEVRFSLPSSFSNIITYSIGKPDKQLVFQVIDSKSISSAIPDICGPIIMQLNLTDMYAKTSTTLPDFLVFD